MKWLVLLMIAANAGSYFLLSAAQPQSKRAYSSPAVKIPEQQKLLLLSEQASEEIPSASTKTDDETYQLPGPSGRPGDVPDADLQPARETTVFEQASIEQVITDAPPSAGLKKTPVERSCYRLGPFDSQEDYRHLNNKFGELGYQVEVYQGELEELNGFWVYLSSPDSLSGFASLREKLRAEKLDGYLIPDGNLAGNISLGLFSSLDNALSHQRLAISKGYQPKISESYRNKPRYWLAVELPEGQISLDLEKLEIDPKKTQKEACEKVASRGQFH